MSEISTPCTPTPTTATIAIIRISPGKALMPSIRPVHSHSTAAMPVVPIRAPIDRPDEERDRDADRGEADVERRGGECPGEQVPTELVCSEGMLQGRRAEWWSDEFSDPVGADERHQDPHDEDHDDDEGADGRAVGDPVAAKDQARHQRTAVRGSSHSAITSERKLTSTTASPRTRTMPWTNW